MEEQGVMAVDAYDFHGKTADLEKDGYYEIKQGYRHVPHKSKRLELSWSVVYYSDEVKSTDLFVEVELTFLDMRSHVSGGKLLLRYKVSNEVWRYSFMKPENGELSDEAFTYMKTHDLAQREDQRLDPSVAIDQIRSIAEMYKLLM